MWVPMMWAKELLVEGVKFVIEIPTNYKYFQPVCISEMMKHCDRFIAYCIYTSLSRQYIGETDSVLV